jgi:hypothetical protein
MTSTAPAPRTSKERALLLDQLAHEVVALRRSDAWQRYLAVQARFHRYSPRNVMLIALQRPEATSVAGFRTWASLGRQVRRGERALSILAPMVRRSAGDEELLVMGFRWVSVFDVSQTVGEPLPTPVSLLEGAGPSALRASLERAATTAGFEVVLDELPAGVNGECRWSSATIALSATTAPLQQAKTLAHELGHALLHRHEPDRARAEIEAESVAYVVLAAHGADATAYSAGYLASWLGDSGDPTLAIRRSLDAIQRASSEILCAMEEPTDARRASSHPSLHLVASEARTLQTLSAEDEGQRRELSEP